MKIMSINAGSSSLKFSLFDMSTEEVLISGVFERIGIEGGTYTLKYKVEIGHKTEDVYVDDWYWTIFGWEYGKVYDHTETIYYLTIHITDDATLTSIVGYDENGTFNVVFTKDGDTYKIKKEDYDRLYLMKNPNPSRKMVLTLDNDNEFTYTKIVEK